MLVIYVTVPADGRVRTFDRLRRNDDCIARGGNCHLFGNMKPPPIPDDIYKKIGYQVDLDWMITSSAGTGKFPWPKCMQQLVNKIPFQVVMFIATQI